MKIGDVAVVKDPMKFQLACGSGVYTHAIVVSIDPFILVSEWGDMLWTEIEPERFTFLCKADSKIIDVAVKRWENDKQKYIKT